MFAGRCVCRLPDCVGSIGWNGTTQLANPNGDAERQGCSLGSGLITSDTKNQSGVGRNLGGLMDVWDIRAEMKSETGMI